MSRLRLPRAVCTILWRGHAEGKKSATEKHAEEAQLKNKTNECIPQQCPYEEAWWPWLRGDRKSFSLMTSAEQAVGKAALVVSIKSENGQNASNPQPAVSRPAPRVRALHNRCTGRLVCSKASAYAGPCPSLEASARRTAPLGCKGEGSASTQAVAEPRDPSSGQDHDCSQAMRSKPSPGDIQNGVF